MVIGTMRFVQSNLLTGGLRPLCRNKLENVRAEELGHCEIL